MEDAFLVAFNQLTTINVPDVDLYEKKFLPIIGRTDSLNNDLIEEHTKLEALYDEIEAVATGSVRAKTDGEEKTKKLIELEDKISSRKAVIADLKARISEQNARSENVRIFLQGLRDCNSILEQFDVAIWSAVVEYATVMPDKTMVFHFRNGDDISVPLEETH